MGWLIALRVVAYLAGAALAGWWMPAPGYLAAPPGGVDVSEGDGHPNGGPCE